jgi:hypothetical protein
MPMSGFGDYGSFSWPRYTDIDLFKMKDGEPVQSREDWWIKRRPEIFKLVQHEIYGNTLVNFIPKITWTVTPGTAATGTMVGSDGNTYAYTQKKTGRSLQHNRVFAEGTHAAYEIASPHRLSHYNSHASSFFPRRVRRRNAMVAASRPQATHAARRRFLSILLICI